MAAVAGLVLLLSTPSGTDLTAQQARAGFAAAHPLSALDLRWYGGVQPGAYSWVSPYVMAVVGVRLTGVLAAVASAWLTGLLLIRWQVRRAGWAATWAALGFVADIVDGRVTFALGLAVALAALVCVPTAGARRWRWAPAIALAVLSALTSPVAAVFLALVALGWALRRRSVAALAVAAVLPLGVIDLLFPEPGRMPDTWSAARPDLLAAIAVVLLCRGRTVRAVAAVYALAVVIVYLHPGPVGSNDERLALLATGPVLICCWRLPRVLLLVALVVVGYWTTTVPIRDLHRSGALATERASAHRLVGVLGGLGPITGRVEVVPFRDHGEADIVGTAWPLARGWERQVDVLRNATLYDGRLSAGRYLGWLRANAVQYVALGRHAHDFGAIHELQLLAHPPSYLVPVHRDREWTVWRVADGTPMVATPGRLVRVTAATLTVTTVVPSDVAVDVHWSRWWRVSGDACLRRSGDRLVLRLRRAETVTLSSSYLQPSGGPRC